VRASQYKLMRVQVWKIRELGRKLLKSMMLEGYLFITEITFKKIRLTVNEEFPILVMRNVYNWS